MTRHMTATILLLAVAALPGLATEACAQKGLHVNGIYEGEVVERSCMIENQIRGQQLEQYKLHLFRSIKFKATEEERAETERRVEADMQHAQDLEMERSGRLNYAMMTLPPAAGGKAPQQGERRYLCYQCVPMRSGYAITLVFMQGHATLKEMRAMFKKK